MRKQLRKAMVCTIAMMLVAVISLTGVTYAWFSQSDTAIVEGISLGIVASDGGVLMSAIANPTSWATRLNLNMNKKDFYPSSTAPSNMKPDGTLKFFNGIVNEYSNGEIKTEEIAPAAGEEKYYIKQDLFIYNESQDEPMIVQLDPTATTVGTGDVSMAMRLAIVNHGDYEEGTDGTVYVPGTENEFIPTADNVQIFEFNATGHLGASTAPITTYPVIAASGETFFDVSDEEDKIKDGNNDTNSIYLGEANTYHKDSVNPLSFEVGAGKCHKITVYIWLEGQDVDCKNAISGSTMDIKIGFTKG